MDIHVTEDGWLTWGAPEERVRCALGRGGVSEKRREGDGVTPAGSHPLRRVWYRGDKMTPPPTNLPLITIATDDGWCDDATAAAYNTHVRLPIEASHERLCREDGLYDIVVEVGFNDDPVVPGRGSAIFVHIAQPDYTPTEGCVAVALDDMLELLKDCDEKTRLVIG